jgi:hypothetical protein
MVRHAPSEFRMVRDTSHPDFSGWKFFARKRTTHLARSILSPYLTNANTRYELCKIEVLSNTQHFHFNACGARPVKTTLTRFAICNTYLTTPSVKKKGRGTVIGDLHTGPHHTRSFLPRTSFWHHIFFLSLRRRRDFFFQLRN